MQFAALPLSPPLQQTLHDLGFTELTPIQAAALPILLTGRDLLGQSQTGSGKTLSFLIPLLEKLDPQRDVQAMVLCPTRELASQVLNECRRVGRHLPGLRVLALVGGQPFAPQAASLHTGAHVVVGTPGRVLDHLRRGTLHTEPIRTVVLDEADRMLEMGFYEQMEEIRAALPAPRQTVMFSATFPAGIQALSASWLQDPARVEADVTPVAEIRERSLLTEDKIESLKLLLREQSPETALVFCNQKETVRLVVTALQEGRFSADGLHGDLLQEERDEVLARLRNQSLRVVVATDVAARGLDVLGLDMVINYDLPSQPDIYVHRVGRTGRAGAPGLAVSLHHTRDQSKLQWFADTRGQPILPMTLGDAAMLPPPAPAPMVTIRIFGGRRDKLRPGDVLGALTGDGGLPASVVGRIEIGERVSFVAVARERAEEAWRQLAEGRIKARRFRVERR